MIELIDFISQPWHWAVSGSAIAILMFLLLYSGEKFGVSTSFETICSMGGLGKKIKLFDYDWKGQSWLLVFLFGAVIGGLIGTTILQSPQPVQISAETTAHLQSLDITVPQDVSQGLGFVPSEIFSFDKLTTLPGFIMLVIGGFFIGFGTRWASGCTSGHAISGLSNLQPASLIAVIGFFIGGLTMTHFLLPIILNL